MSSFNGKSKWTFSHIYSLQFTIISGKYMQSYCLHGEQKHSNSVLKLLFHSIITKVDLAYKTEFKIMCVLLYLFNYLCILQWH